MSDLTLEDKTSYAARKAIELEAGKHFFEAAQPFFPFGFSVTRRNPGHWDVFAPQCPGRHSAWMHAHPEGQSSGRDGGEERAFRIRGEPGKVIVFDERWDPTRPEREPQRFRSVMGAMVYIMEELMQEPEEKHDE